MLEKSYHFTKIARIHLQKIIRETKQKWGIEQAKKYKISILNGVEDIALHYSDANFPHRTIHINQTDYFIHLIEQHYVIFKPYKDAMIVAGFLHKNMDIANRLKDLQQMNRYEIDTLKRLIEQL